MPRNKSKQPAGISWKTVLGILGSIAVLVGSIVSGLDFINYLREGYQQFLWLGIVMLGAIWFIVLWLLFKQRNIYWMLYLMVTILAGVVIWKGWHSYIQTREDKLVVLIAKFDGPEEVYGLRNEILEKLNQDFASDLEIEIESINEVITPDSDSGSPRAVELGKSFQADVVIWGWYRPTENPNITIHVENMSPNDFSLIKESEIYSPSGTLTDLESFELQKQIGEDASNLLLFLKGYIRARSKDCETALSIFDKILHAEKISSLVNQKNVLFLSGDCHLYLYQLDRAIQDYDKAIEIDMGFEEALNNRALTYGEIGEYERALQEFGKLIQTDLSHADFYYNNRSEIYNHLGQLDNAIKDLDKAIEINPNEPYLYNSRGAIYINLGQEERAIQDFNKAIQFRPNIALFYNNRGVAFGNLGQVESAIDDYSKAIELDPSDVGAYSNRGLGYVSLGQYDRAQRDFDQAIHINPNDSENYIRRGLFYYYLRQYDYAIQDYDKAIELNPQSVNGYFNRGNVHYDLNQYDYAIKDYSKVIELAPQSPTAYLNRGLAYYQKGTYWAAIIDYNQAIQIDPDDSGAYLGRGRVFQKLGKTAEAEADFKKYEELTGEKP